MAASNVIRGFIFILFALFLSGLFFSHASAQFDGAVSASQCLPWDKACPCGGGTGPKCRGPGPNKANCAPGICKKIVNGFPTNGICSAPGFCEGVSSAGAGGELGSAQQLLGITKQIMDLFKGQGGGGGGGGGSGSSIAPTSCYNYYTVTTTSTDPCAIYSPTLVSDTLAPLPSTSSLVSDTLLNALSGGSGTKATVTTSGGVNSSGAATSSGSQAQASSTVPTNAGQLQSGLFGDVRLGDGGSTIVANLREGASEIAGFFGASTFGSSQTAVGRMCATRPWAGSGFFANLVPDTFFDSLCRGAGYQVGITLTPTATPTGSQKTFTSTSVQATTTTQQPVVNTIKPEVDIWAEPATVRLGTRTYIFWNSKGTVSCVASGPSFSQNSLSGGASTVPISDASTFSIECTAPDGTKVQDSVTVNLSL